MASHVEFVLDHAVGAEQQILHRDVFFDGVGSAVEFSRAVPAKIERRLAQGLRRNRAEIDAAAAEHGLSFDDRDFLVELGTLNCGALPSRSGTDHQKIVVESLSGHSPAPLWVDPAGCYSAGAGHLLCRCESGATLSWRFAVGSQFHFRVTQQAPTRLSRL